MVTLSSNILNSYSVVLSLGGQGLWKQFTSAINRHSSIHEMPQPGKSNYTPTPSVIWLPVKTAMDAVKAIFVKAMEQQVREALEIIDALKEAPNFHFEEHDLGVRL